MKRFLLVLFLVPVHLLAWTDDALLMWMDFDRAHSLEPIAKRFENDFWIKVTIDAGEVKGDED
jgi:hypothetical protein